MGVRREDGIVILKGFDPIDEGDTLAIYYQARIFEADGSEREDWYMGDEFTVEGELNLECQNLNEDYFYSNLFVDVRDEKFFGELKPVVVDSY